MLWLRRIQQRQHRRQGRNPWGQLRTANRKKRGHFCRTRSRFGRVVRGGGKGALIQTDKSATLSTLQDQTLCQPILLESNQNHASIRTDGVCTTLPAAMGMGGGYTPMVCAIENHPQDSRVKLSEDNVVQTLSSKMGTGGGMCPW